jgi:4-amino-4-deoxy-L-arabinose transferase-like glycosyltransferase
VNNSISSENSRKPLADNLFNTIVTALTSSTLRSQRRFYLALSGIVVAVCWLLPTRDSLWLDETGTYWIVKDSIRSVFERSYYWSNFSPYYLVAWPAVHLGGHNEIIIRLPSIIAMGVATFFIYRIGTRLCDEETGLVAAAVFVAIQGVSYAAADARPYAFTLMALTGFVLALLRWLDKTRFLDAVAVVLLATLTAYGHVLLAIGLVVPTLYALWRTTKRLRFISMFVIIGLLIVPLVIQIRAYMSMGTPHMFAEVPTLPDLFSAIAPPQLLATLIVGLGTAYAIHSVVQSQWRPAKPVVVMLLAWLVFAPSLIFLLGRTTTIQLFLPRYLLSTSPAAALLMACFIRSLDPMTVRRVVVGVILGLSVAGWVMSSSFHHGEDWRGAMATVRQETEGTSVPVFMASCFIEAQTPKDLNDPRLKEILFAPELFYRPTGRVIHLPYRFDEAYVKQVAEKELAGESRFLMLSCGENDTVVGLSRYAADRQFQLERFLNFRGLELRQFRLSSSRSD